jgi:hypothetical protein
MCLADALGAWRGLSEELEAPVEESSGSLTLARLSSHLVRSGFCFIHFGKNCGIQMPQHARSVREGHREGRRFVRSSGVISGHQRSSAAISGHQRPSVVISGHQWSSAAISGHQRPSVVISGHQWPSKVIRGHQRSSEVISRAHSRTPQKGRRCTHSTRERPARRLGAWRPPAQGWIGARLSSIARMHLPRRR